MRCGIALRATGLDGDVRPLIRLISPTGVELERACCGIVNQINATVPAAGTYTVIISSLNAGGGRTGTGNYLLTLAP